MIEFEKPLCDIIRFTNDVVATSCPSDCDCDFGFGPTGDTTCTNLCQEADGDMAECIIQGDQGNC